MPTHSLAVLTDTIVHLFHPDDMVIVIEQRQIPRIPPPVLVSARLLYRNRTSWSQTGLDRRMVFKTL
jgi:hypothetical protein